MKIFIPTMGRLEKQYSYQAFKDAGLNPKLVVCKGEYEAHCKMYGEKNVVICPKKGIGPTRQYIVECLSKDKNIIMCDDDMTFFYRKDLSKTQLTKCGPSDITNMVNDIKHLMFFYNHGGVSARQGNNNVVGENYKENTRINNFHFINCRKLNDEGIRFDELEVMEDFHVTLSMLTRGYKNACLYRYCWNQRGSGAEGGCSSYRTKEVQAIAANKLKEAFPNYVTVVEKDTKGVGVFDGKRKDVRIQWKKAYTPKPKLVIRRL